MELRYFFLCNMNVFFLNTPYPGFQWSSMVVRMDLKKLVSIDSIQNSIGSIRSSIELHCQPCPHPYYEPFHIMLNRKSNWSGLMHMGVILKFPIFLKEHYWIQNN